MLVRIMESVWLGLPAWLRMPDFYVRMYTSTYCIAIYFSDSRARLELKDRWVGSMDEQRLSTKPNGDGRWEAVTRAEK